VALDFYHGGHRMFSPQSEVPRLIMKQLTCLVGIVGYFFLVDFPEKAHKSRRFLSEKECNFIIRRVNKDRGDVAAEPFSIKAFLKPANDLEIWGFAMIFL
jgi:hypothetical protein